MLHLETLGSLRINKHRVPLTGLKTRKVQALLVYLVYYAGASFSREHLQTLLWSESGQKQAANSLRQALVILRSELPEGALHLDGMEVRFDASCPHSLDLAHLRDQPDLYRGPFLHGFVVRNAPVWDEWVAVERERIAAELLDHLLWLAGKVAATDRGAAIRYLQQALQLDGWREHVHRQLMRLHWLNGDRAAALRQYERCRTVLQEALDISPSFETPALAERIRRGDEPFPTNLPHQGSHAPFVGRTVEQARLAEFLTRHRLLTLMGAGGMGKTRLAIEVAHQVRYRFVDGVWFIGLEGIPTAETLSAAIATTIGFRFSGNASQRSQLQAYLRDKEMLLVLDNYEHLLPSTHLITELLSGTSALRVLVTSRVLLDLRNEKLFVLGGLSLADSEHEESEAVRLFLTYARHAQMDFDPGEDRDSVRKLAHLLEGMPLGLEMAAAWLRVMSPLQIVEEVERNTAFLHSTRRDMVERQRSLEAVFSYSWQLLTPAEQAALSSLTLFQGGWNLAGFRRVVRAPIAVLHTLVGHSLVHQENGRYRLHERLRQWVESAHSGNSDPTTAQGVRIRYCQHYLSLLTQQERALVRGTVAEQQAAAEQLQPDLDNIRRGWWWAAREGLLEELNAAAESLFAHYFQVTHLHDEVLALWDDTIHVIEASPLAEQRPGVVLLSRLYSQQARILVNQGNFEKSLERLAHSEPLARQAADPELLARSLALLGHSYWLQGYPDKAAGHLQEGLALCEAHGLPRTQADCIIGLGALALGRGDFTAAADQFRRAIALQEEHESELLRVWTLSYLAPVAEDLEQRTGYTTRIIEVCKQAGDRATWAFALTNHASAHERAGEYHRAYEMNREAMQVSEPLAEDWLLTTYILNNTASSCLLLGKVDEAELHARRAAAISATMDAVQFKALAISRLGHAATLRGDYEESQRLFLDSQAAFEATGAPRSFEYTEVMSYYARYLQQVGRLAEAEATLQEMQRYHEETLNWDGWLFAALTLTGVRLERGEQDGARETLQLVLEGVRGNAFWSLLPGAALELSRLLPDEQAAPLLHYAAGSPRASYWLRQRAERIMVQRGVAPAPSRLPEEPHLAADELLRLLHQASHVP